MGSKHGTASSAIKTYVLGTPNPDTALCVSGANSGVLCTFRVDGGGHQFSNSAGTALLGPFIETRITGSCTIGGDSGSPYFNTVTGGVRVYRIHYGATAPDSDGTCRTYYSRLYDPYRLYDAVPIEG